MKVTRIIAFALLIVAVGSVVFWPDHGHHEPAPATAAVLPTEPAAPTTVSTEVPPTTAVPSTAPATTQPHPTVAAAPTALAQRTRCGPGSPLTATAFPGADPQGAKQWITVGQLQGVCNGRSGVFHMNGIDTRLLFRSDADSFAVFLVDAKLGLDATSGYSDGDCSGRCSANQVLVDKAGDYYLMVQAGDGPWQVAVQEYR